jgi:hypothetical protein
VFSFLLGSSPVVAHEMIVSEVVKPYDIVSLETNIETMQVHLGELNNFPVMYEVVLVASSTISTSLQQEYRGNENTVPFGIMVVRQNERGGVSEVARYNPEQEEWSRIKKPELGLVLQRSEQVSEEVGPGTYRIEVSSPNNQGLYVLKFGVGDIDEGYFESLGHARTMQKFFGYSIVKMLTSSLVYYPLGILFLLFAIQRTWKYRKIITNGS